MIIRILVSFVLLLLWGCIAQNENKLGGEREGPSMHQPLLKDSDLEARILEISDVVMRKQGFNLDEFERKILQDSLTYQVRYSLKDSTRLGGGGIITISKKSLEVINKVFEQ